GLGVGREVGECLGQCTHVGALLDEGVGPPVLGVAHVHPPLPDKPALPDSGLLHRSSSGARTPSRARASASRFRESASVPGSVSSQMASRMPSMVAAPAGRWGSVRT